LDIFQKNFKVAFLRLPIRLPNIFKNPCSLTILCTYG